MKENELNLIKKICDDSEISDEMFVELIKLEKEYASLNMERRQGIFFRLNLILDKYNE